MLGLTEKYLLEKIEAEGSIHLTLIDPEKVTVEQATSIAENSKNSGTAAIMIGGSTFASQAHLDNVVKSIKSSVKLPTILFPNNVTGISSYADAMWFMSLLNSVDPYFLMLEKQSQYPTINLNLQLLMLLPANTLGCTSFILKEVLGQQLLCLLK